MRPPFTYIFADDVAPVVIFQTQTHQPAKQRLALDTVLKQHKDSKALIINKTTSDLKVKQKQFQIRSAFTYIILHGN